ncbi:MAG: DUF3168 domain-containing protein [Wolbachia endosymbiont of Fragariocoptes setiger]|nr:DUF3168 domain-containing protein [Wolbachia endosymbiont of Fragariocoptes setiger]
MKKVKIIQDSIYSIFHSDTVLMQYVTSIYDYSPKQAIIPYLKLYITDMKTLQMLSYHAIKIKFSCDIYAYCQNNMFSILENVYSILNNIKDYDIVEKDYVLKQYGEVMHTVVSFYILIKGNSDE